MKINLFSIHVIACIRALREVRGIQQSEMAFNLNTCECNYSKLENGYKMLQIEDLKIVATVLDVPILIFIYMDEHSTFESLNATVAMFALFDSLIKKYSNQNLILDFEGGNSIGMASFYEGFGAKNGILTHVLNSHYTFPKIFQLYEGNYDTCYTSLPISDIELDEW